MSKKIFYRENFCKRNPKKRNRVLPGDKANFRGDGSITSRNDKIKKNKSVYIYYYIILLFYLLLFFNYLSFKMNSSKSRIILSSFGSCLDNLHSFFNPFNLSKFDFY